MNFFLVNHSQYYFNLSFSSFSIIFDFGEYSSSQANYSNFE